MTSLICIICSNTIHPISKHAKIECRTSEEGRFCSPDPPDHHWCQCSGGHDSGWIFEIGQRKRNCAPASKTPPGTKRWCKQEPTVVFVGIEDDSASLSNLTSENNESLPTSTMTTMALSSSAPTNPKPKRKQIRPTASAVQQRRGRLCPCLVIVVVVIVVVAGIIVCLFDCCVVLEGQAQ